MDFHYSIATFLLALAGFALHFLLSWGAAYRDPLTPKMGPMVYLLLDLPGWIASLFGCAVLYWCLPEVGQFLAGQFTIRITPLWSFIGGYFGSSAVGKLLGIIAGRIGLR